MPSDESWRPRYSMFSTEYRDFSSLMIKFVTLQCGLQVCQTRVVVSFRRTKHQNIIEIDNNITTWLKNPL